MNRRQFLNSTVAAGALAVAGRVIPASADTDPFVQLDGMAQADLVRRGEVTPLELVDAAIARIEKLNPTINAVVHTTFEKARTLAKSGDIPTGPFSGVPYLIKDASELEGEPLTFGSRLFGPNIADRDNASVTSAKDAGLIVLGKTNLPEFGLMSTSESQFLGDVKNPWDLSRSAGGSSGGAAAAVASGMVPFAHASDGAGSIRIPASACGLVGLKPGRGRLDVSGDDPLPVDFAARLAVSRSVRDTAQILNVSERKGKDAEFDPVGFVTGPDSRRLRIGFSTLTVAGKAPAAAVGDALMSTARLCEDLGHTVVESQPTIDYDEMLNHFMGLWASFAASLADNAWLIGLTQFRWMTAERGLEPWTRGLAEYFEQREAANPGVLERSVAYFNRLTRDFDAYFDTVDVSLTPVVTDPALPLGTHAPDVPFDALFKSMTDYAAYTAQHNAAGTAAISLPLSTSPEGLPIGSHFAARRGGEATLLHLAYELEAARPWANHWAPHSAA